jgi:hypothetical protein
MQVLGDVRGTALQAVLHGLKTRATIGACQIPPKTSFKVADDWLNAPCGPILWERFKGKEQIHER